MATLCSRLTHCLSTTKHLYWRQNISNIDSIKSFLCKRLVSQSVMAPRSNPPIVLRSSQATSDMSIGTMKNQAEQGLMSGGDNYDSNRPSYTDESVDLIVSEVLSTLKAVPETGLKYNVLELGAGTGKLTERLSKKLPENVTYLASDPSENFLGVLKSKGLNVDVANATADSIPLADRSVGNVVCAHCFHWFAEKENIESIHRVLAPGGKLILIWNMKQFDHDWMIAFYMQRKAVIKKICGSMKYLANSVEWRKHIDVSQDFKLLSYKSLPGINFQGDLETILAHVSTDPSYNALPVEEREAYVDKLRQIFKSWPGLNIKDITMPFTTELYVYVAQ